MSKYEPLQLFLERQNATEIPLCFAEIEEIIGSKLPPAAHRHRAWWSNNPSNNVMTRSWLTAGYASERVDIAAERVVFRRQSDRPPPGPRGATPKAGFLDRIRAQLAGMTTVAEGVDLTGPTGETWDAER
ncbi:MAG: hypothetical protein ABIO39_15740 [Caulobacteraceae bacterium]